MKRIFTIMRKDFSSSVRDNLLLYGLLAPILIALALRFFIPLIQENSINIVMLEDSSKKFQEQVRLFADVELVENEAQMQARINNWDDTVGFKKTPDGEIVVIMEGNEEDAVKEIAQAVANKINGTLEHIPVKVRDLELYTSPFPTYMIILASITGVFIGGMIIAFNIIEEKENNTFSALAVTPMKKYELYIGHSITGFVVSFVMPFLVLLIAGVKDVNFINILILTVGSVFTSIIFGFMIGSVSTNQINGIANLKIGMLPFIIPPIIAMMISPEKEMFLYWAPTYWTFTGMRDTLIEGVSLTKVLTPFSITMLINLILLMGVYRLIVGTYSRG